MDRIGNPRASSSDRANRGRANCPPLCLIATDRLSSDLIATASRCGAGSRLQAATGRRTLGSALRSAARGLLAHAPSTHAGLRGHSTRRSGRGRHSGCSSGHANAHLRAAPARTPAPPGPTPAPTPPCSRPAPATAAPTPTASTPTPTTTAPAATVPAAIPTPAMPAAAATLGVANIG